MTCQSFITDAGFPPVAGLTKRQRNSPVSARNAPRTQIVAVPALALKDLILRRRFGLNHRRGQTYGEHPPRLPAYLISREWIQLARFSVDAICGHIAGRFAGCI